MSIKTINDVPEYVKKCLQLAILLEVSAYPKPGNVHRTANFQNTRYEHFLASAIAVAPHMKYAGERGLLVQKQKISVSEVGIGEVIKSAVSDVNAWQNGGNTLLGSIILLAPIAVAAGMTLVESTSFSVERLRNNLKVVVEGTTPLDAVNLYKAIEIAEPGGLGNSPSLDVNDPFSLQLILDRGITLYEIFKVSAQWDTISWEWINEYYITFVVGYPYLSAILRQQLSKTIDVNIATVHTFLKILSEVPDTHIARKANLAKAKEVSAHAKRILNAGGLTTRKGRTDLMTLDAMLRNSTCKLNPGTTADITSAVLAISILNGYRP